MASNQRFRDLQCVLRAFETESLSLHSISFYLSQPVSGCYQETENSMNINISTDDLEYFSLILIMLGPAKSTLLSLRNLEFHCVEWELQQVQNLGELLDSNLNIKQLVFRRNRFGEDCLSEFSDVLKRNGAIKEVMFSESHIGTVGATLLAFALMVNDSLEELQIWEDSIGSKGAEELSKMIEANSMLKLLTIFDSSSITATPLISAVLARNRAMEVHVWSGASDKSSKLHRSI
ncbi:hypothetical protein V6N11_020795 [Hibiscus sabdariffa]|uniref:Uncharacterized protein n=1 Tax=Hibiscus sabdariffa TaxID=183260 RepID=A0ABR2Q9H6_9ROSI